MPREVPRGNQEIRTAFTVVSLLLAAAAPAVAADAANVANGAYLAAAAGCDTCHTDSEHGGQPFAGGRQLQTAYGILTTPNLTPDRAAGIGRWSGADFTRALRWGIAPDDSHYVPAFPFLFYNRLSDGDLGDLKTFLDSLAPVSRTELGGVGAMALLARARAAVAVAATPLPGPWQNDPRHDATWNRGAYLVAAVGRCGDCHTPRTLIGVSDQRYFLAGGWAGPDGKHAPNITPDRESGIGKWNADDIFGVLTDGHTPDFDFVGGAMAEIVKNTSRLSETDRRAIAAYLQSLPAVSTPETK